MFVTNKSIIMTFLTSNCCFWLKYESSIHNIALLNFSWKYDQETNSSTSWVSWGWVHSQQMNIFRCIIPLNSLEPSIFVNLCLLISKWLRKVAYNAKIMFACAVLYSSKTLLSQECMIYSYQKVQIMLTPTYTWNIIHL